jgi:2-keto-4-pentenoate hydratase
MPSQSTEQLIQAYVAAHRDPYKPVSATALQALDAAGAMAVQGEVLRGLGETASVAKVAAPAGRPALAAPIIDSWVTKSGGTLQLHGRNMMGLEIEIAAVLKSDLTPDIALRGKAAVLAAIDHFIVGIELIGTRIDQYKQAGPYGPLSDFMVTSGYVTGQQVIPTLPDVDGLSITLETAAGTTQLGPAKHPFGGVIEPIIAYASAPFDHFGGLRAGMTITTGSLCPLIEITPTGTARLQLGDFEPVSFSFVD